jgi:hypothetical protein
MKNELQVELCSVPLYNIICIYQGNLIFILDY